MLSDGNSMLKKEISAMKRDLEQYHHPEKAVPFRVSLLAVSGDVYGWLLWRC